MDLALLQIESKEKFTPLSFGDSDKVVKLYSRLELQVKELINRLEHRACKTGWECVQVEDKKDRI